MSIMFMGGCKSECNCDRCQGVVWPVPGKIGKRAEKILLGNAKKMIRRMMDHQRKLLEECF